MTITVPMIMMISLTVIIMIIARAKIVVKEHGESLKTDRLKTSFRISQNQDLPFI